MEKSSSKDPFLQETHVAGLCVRGTGSPGETHSAERCSQSQVCRTLPSPWQRCPWGFGSAPTMWTGAGSAQGHTSIHKFSASVPFCNPPSVFHPGASLRDRLCHPLLLPVLQ